MLPPLKLFALKLAIFSSVLAYLAVDLLLWQGPVWSLIHRNAKPTPTWVDPQASVYGQVIEGAQLDVYCQELAFLSGQESIEAKRRISALMDLIRAELLRVRAQYNDKNLPDTKQAAEAEFLRLQTRSSSPELFAQQLAQVGLDEATFKALLETRLKEVALLQRALEPYCEVSDEELRASYADLKAELTIPAQRSLKHIFLLKNQPESAAQAILLELQAGADFASLAAAKSEDEASAPMGGDLGLIADDVRRPLPELKLFGDGSIPAHQYLLLPSSWGWHILIAGEIVPARPASFDECAESLRSALQSAKRELALQAYLDASIQEALQTKQIKIYVR